MTAYVRLYGRRLRNSPFDELPSGAGRLPAAPCVRVRYRLVGDGVTTTCSNEVQAVEGWGQEAGLQYNMADASAYAEAPTWRAHFSKLFLPSDLESEPLVTALAAGGSRRIRVLKAEELLAAAAAVKDSEIAVALKQFQERRSYVWLKSLRVISTRPSLFRRAACSFNRP
eukprot:2875448-Pleurochrysis_carterae.AAC.3